MLAGFCGWLLPCKSIVLGFGSVADRRIAKLIYTSFILPLGKVNLAKKRYTKSNLYNALRLGAGLLTVVAMVVNQYLPDKTLIVHPSEVVDHSIYWDSKEGEEPSAEWVDEKQDHWRCSFLDHHDFSCGYSLSFNPDYRKGVDLSQFSGFKIKLQYKGDAQRIRIFMRNYDSVIDRSDPLQSAKFQSTVIRISDLQTETFVKLSEFSVAEWWVRAYDVPREHAAPQRDNVITFGFDFLTAGEHEIKVEKIEFSGKWISSEIFYMSILGVWMVLIIWEGLSRFYQIYRESYRSKEQISELQASYKQLEVEKRQFEQLSTTDVLTGITNRAGIVQIVERLFSSDFDRDKIGFMMLDLDHFKRINDTRGHDVGDQILKGISKVISGCIRQSDVFGRWGGEEFVILCAQVEEASFVALAEKLRSAVHKFEFEPDKSLNVSISIGATLCGDNDNFDVTYKRADLALYEAKNKGRNCVVFKR